MTKKAVSSLSFFGVKGQKQLILIYRTLNLFLPRRQRRGKTSSLATCVTLALYLGIAAAGLVKRRVEVSKLKNTYLLPLQLDKMGSTFSFPAPINFLSLYVRVNLVTVNKNYHM